MNNISRRKLVTTGLAATAGVSGLAAVAGIARRHGLIPPDSGGIYGPGETLTYAAQRLLTTHSLAREFSRAMILKVLSRMKSRPRTMPSNASRPVRLQTGDSPSTEWSPGPPRFRCPT